MMTETGRASDEAQIRELIEARAEAIRGKDLAGAMAGIAPDVLVFDVVDPLRHCGLEALGARALQWFSSFRGPIGYEIRDLCITAGADVAFSHSLNRVLGRLTDGTGIDMWWRSTVGYRKVDGRWRITHEHNSVPFDPETGKASLQLQP
jgi:ketosteroid isomerase-like protein